LFYAQFPAGTASHGSPFDLEARVQRNLKNRMGLGLVMGLSGLAISAGLNLSAVRAEDDSRPVIEYPAAAHIQVTPAAEHMKLQPEMTSALPKSVPANGKRKVADKSAGQYFVEFRSRYALSYGHTFLVHGRLGAKGEVKLTPEYVAGLHPKGEGPELWTVGHVMPVPSETGPSDGDLEEQYVSARFRVLLTEDQYRSVAAHIRQKQQTSPTWHAVFYNCNLWVGQIAQFMGLKAPSNNLLYPADYINNLREINGGENGAPLNVLMSSAGSQSYAAAH
jgi:hypothetical protein